MNWLKRFKPNKQIWLPAAITSLIVGLALLAIWSPTRDLKPEKDRYGEALTAALASSTSGLLLHNDRIQLAVIATDVAQFHEVRGIVFYDQGQTILAMAGDQSASQAYTAHAALEDTITGYVSVTLNHAAFQTAYPWLEWVLSLLAILLTPFITLLIVQFTERGNRSLPIVSIPEPSLAERQRSFALIINLHNALALGRRGSETALQDCLWMAQEVCALHPGFPLIANQRGAVILFDRHAVSASHAISAAHLLMNLLADYETDGQFRCYLSEMASERNPADMTELKSENLDPDFDIEHALTIAALSRPGSLLVDAACHAELSAVESTWCEAFAHPLLEEDEKVFVVSALPEQQTELVNSRKTVILNFSE